MAHVPCTLTSNTSGASVLLSDPQSVINSFIIIKYIESEPIYWCVSHYKKILNKRKNQITKTGPERLKLICTSASKYGI